MLFNCRLLVFSGAIMPSQVQSQTTVVPVASPQFTHHSNSEQTNIGLSGR